MDKAQTGSAVRGDRVERIAREVMGWTLSKPTPARRRRLTAPDHRWWIADGKPVAEWGVWDPFTDANADVQVLGAAKARWLKEKTPEAVRCWEAFTNALCHDITGEELLPWEYATGTFARAALAAADVARFIRESGGAAGGVWASDEEFEQAVLDASTLSPEVPT